MEKMLLGKTRVLHGVITVWVISVTIAGCVPAAKKVTMPPTETPPVKEVEVVVAVPQPAEPSEPATAMEGMTKTDEQQPVPVFQVQEPQIVVEERLVLPDGEMFAARYRFFTGLEGKFQTLSDYLDWFGREEGVPELGNCLLLIDDIMEGYDGAMRLLEETDSSETGTLDELQPWQVVWRDISFIQGDCQAVYDEKSTALVELLQQYDRPPIAPEENHGGEPVLSMDDKAIESYRYLIGNFPRWKGDADLLTKYGQALLRRGLLKEAGDVFLEVLSGKDSTTADLALRKKTADLLLTTGRRNEALAQYRKLAEIEQFATASKETTTAHLALLEGGVGSKPQFRIYQRFMREYYTFNGREISDKAHTALNQLENFYSGSPLTEHARALLAEMEKTARQSIEKALADAGQLVEEKKYDQAIKVLKELSREKLAPDLAEAVHYQLQEISFDAAEEQKTQAWEEREQLAGRWQRAQDLFDRHQYDAAVELYASFGGTVHEEEAASQIQKAIDEAAGELRKRAATLFLKARKENDVTMRMAYLHESLSLLRQVEEKYSQAAIYDKVIRNMAVLEKEIASLAGTDELP